MTGHFPIDESLVLGIDLGIGSCGTALARPQVKEGASHIAFMGSRCFEVPESPKTKELKNRARRSERLLRRVTRRRRQRLSEIRHLLHECGVLQSLDPKELHDGKNRPNPWRCRAEGLTRMLTREEFATVLVHIAKHRGFKSTKKSDQGENAPADNQKMLSGIAAIKEKSARYETVGQMIFLDDAFKAKKRNSDGDYSHTLPRDLQAHEIEVLFERQRAFGNDRADTELEEAYAQIAFRQLPVADSEVMVGFCPFEPAEKRAAKHCYSFELFRFLSKVVNLRVKSLDGSTRRLREEEIRDAARDFGGQKSITYKTLRKVIGLTKGTSFEGIKPEDEKRDVAASSGSAAAGTYALRSCLGDSAWRSLLATPEMLDRIAFVLAFREDIDSIRSGLAEIGMPPLIFETLMQGVARGDFGHFARAGHISAKAARNLIPHLLRGCVYSEACEEAGYDHTATQTVTLDDIRNPVVVRALREALRQVKTLIHEFGVCPGAIHVELARDLGKGPDERKKIEDGINNREVDKERHRKEFMEVAGRPSCSDDELLRYELWKEQEHKCIYTGTYISPVQLVATDNSIQVDHILPRSRSQDNSFVNKVLCTTGANQEKKRHSPWEWKNDDPAWWATFDARVEALKIKGRKKRNLLLKTFEERREKYASRNLNDTRYAARALMAELQKLYGDADGADRRVFARPGSLTSLLRRAWGVEFLKKGKNGERLPDDRNHALDALVVACTTEAVLQGVTRAYQALEDQGRADFVPKVAPPWTGFREDAVASFNNVVVSRSEKRRARGKGHDATIRQVREEDGRRIVYERKKIKDMTLKDLDRIKDVERNGKIKDALRSWIESGKPKDALPRSPRGDAIQKVRLRMGEKAGISVRNGHADNADMVRTDVFAKDGKYYLVPIYSHQIANKREYVHPPRLAIVAAKPEGEWVAIDESFDFLFSLYPDSYIEVLKSDGEVIEGYYRGTSRSTSAVSISPQHRHDDDAIRPGVGARTLRQFRKFTVDRLGRKHEVPKEKRTWHGAACT